VCCRVVFYNVDCGIHYSVTDWNRYIEGGEWARRRPDLPPLVSPIPVLPASCPALFDQAVLATKTRPSPVVLTLLGGVVLPDRRGRMCPPRREGSQFALSARRGGRVATAMDERQGC